MKPSNMTPSGKATDMIAGICTFPRLPCPCTKRHVMLKLTSTGVCNTGTSSLYVCNLLWLTWCWMLLYQTFRKITSTNMRKKKLYVVTPTCDAAAAAVVSALVLWRPTKEYTHPYSMMHRRLPTAGIEVALHYHQYLVPVANYAFLMLLFGGKSPLCLPNMCHFCSTFRLVTFVFLGRVPLFSVFLLLYHVRVVWGRGILCFWPICSKKKKFLLVYVSKIKR